MNKAEDFALRPVRSGDESRLLIWRNSDRVRANMYSDHIIATEEHASWFSYVLRDSASDYRVCEHQQRPIGLVAFSNIDKRNGRASWAFYLGEVDTPQGAGAAMEYLALEHAFGPLAIRKLCCEVFAFNSRVVKMHKRFGFQQEGLLVRHVLKNGKYEDVVLLSMFSSEWPERREHLASKIWSNTVDTQER